MNEEQRRPDLAGSTVLLRDLMDATVAYECDGGDLARRGLYLDVPGWRPHVFEISPRGQRGVRVRILLDDGHGWA